MLGPEHMVQDGANHNTIMSGQPVVQVS